EERARGTEPRQPAGRPSGVQAARSRFLATGPLNCGRPAPGLGRAATGLVAAARANQAPTEKWRCVAPDVTPFRVSCLEDAAKRTRLYRTVLPIDSKPPPTPPRHSVCAPGWRIFSLLQTGS